MKFTTLFSLAATVAQVQAKNVGCNVIDSTGAEGITCEQLTQFSVCDGFVDANNCCDPGQERFSDVRIKSQICDDDTQYGDNSKLELSGPAVDAEVVLYSQMTGDQRTPNGHCLTKQYETQVDRCKPYFDADFLQEDENLPSVDQDMVSKNFMKRNCPLDAWIECSITDDNGDIVNNCVDFATDFNSSTNNPCPVNIEYKYCAESTLVSHDVEFRSEYINPDCDDANTNQCNKESRAAINGNFVADPLADQPNGLGPKLGYSNNNDNVDEPVKCFTHSIQIDTCDGDDKIPVAFMNLVGTVEWAYNSNDVRVAPDASMKDEFKACFKRARFDAVILNTQDTNTGSGPGSSPALEDCDENAPTSAPSAAPSSAPAGPGSKGKGGKGGKGKKCKSKKSPKRIRTRY